MMKKVLMLKVVETQKTLTCMKAILGPIKFQTNPGFKLIIYFYYQSLCNKIFAFLEKTKQVKTDIKHILNKKAGMPNCLHHPLK
jgi:hypothetical protein